MPGNKKPQGHKFMKEEEDYCENIVGSCLFICYFIVRSIHIENPISQITAKPWNISPLILLSAYSSFSFPKDFQIMLYRQFEPVMNTTFANIKPTTTISNKLKNQDLIASLQMHLEWTE